MRLLLLVAALSTLAAPPPAARDTRAGVPADPCRFGRGSPVPESSSWYDQFKCYQSSGRHVSIVGSGTYESGTVSGGICIIGVTRDRVQFAPCGSFSGEWALVLPYDAIAYVVDDARAENVNIYVAALFRR